MNEAVPVVLESVEREILDKIIPEIDPFSYMSINERYFLNGIIRYFHPSRILEVGVAEGEVLQSFSMLFETGRMPAWSLWTT